MATVQNPLVALNDPVAQMLLQSTLPAHLAYVADDGTPRVIPIWFHWTDSELVFGSPPTAPKAKSVTNGSPITVTIDTITWPYKVLQIRGNAEVSTVNGVAREYATAARRYFGEEQGKAWVQQVGSLFPAMTRIALKPTWANILDFEQRFPSAIAAAMAGK
ncbi:MAG: pyridoxamine 5'-phosphate oxidase family protein [Caldilineaceae bacterium]